MIPPQNIMGIPYEMPSKSYFYTCQDLGTFMNRTLIYDTYKHNIIFLQLFHIFFSCAVPVQ